MLQNKEVEAYASASALVRQAQSYMETHKDSLLWDFCGEDINEVNGEIIFAAIKAEDKGAKKVFEQYVGYLACGLTSIANAFRPQVIVLGGGISAVGKILTDPLQRRLSRELYGGQKNAPVKILTATLQNDAGILGAAKLVMVEENR